MSYDDDRRGYHDRQQMNAGRESYGDTTAGGAYGSSSGYGRDNTSEYSRGGSTGTSYGGGGGYGGMSSFLSSSSSEPLNLSISHISHPPSCSPVLLPSPPPKHATTPLRPDTRQKAELPTPNHPLTKPNPIQKHTSKSH